MSNVLFRKIPLLFSIFIGVAACDSGKITGGPAAVQSGSSGAGIAEPESGALSPVDPLLQQGGFESGTDFWSSCGGSVGELVDNTPFGNKALKLSNQSCIYQTSAISTPELLTLTCQTKRDGVGWAALMLGYLDADYEPLDTKEVEITHSAFTNTEIVLNAPTNAKYVEVLGYTTGDAQLYLDNCNLTDSPNQSMLTSNPLANDIAPTADVVARTQSFGTDPSDTAAGEIDWANGWMAHNDQNLWLAWKTHSLVDGASWGLGVYIDTDQNRTTGFRGFSDEYPIGVDFLVEGVEQFVYTGNGTDWSWDSVGLSGGEPHAQATVLRKLLLDRPATQNRFDLFFLGNNKASGGTSVDYYPDGVVNSDAPTAARFFTYNANTAGQPPVIPPVLPPVTPPQPVIPPTTPTGIAMIEIRNNLFGADSWVSNARGFENSLLITNTGDTPLSNVTVSNDVLASCSFIYPSLAPGESKSETCANPDNVSINFGEFYTHTATASATTPNGQTVTHSDSTSFGVSLRQAPRNTLVVTPNSYGANSADEITFTVEAANNGNYRAQFTVVKSNIASCNRDFISVISAGNLERYTCVAPITQLPLEATFSIVGYQTSTTVNIQPADSTSLDVQTGPVDAAITQSQSPTGSRENVTVKNTGVVPLSNVEVTTNRDCSTSVPTLLPNTSETFDCSVPLTTGNIGTLSATATATAPDGSQITGNDTLTTVYKNDLYLDFALGPRYGVITGSAGETVNTTMTFSNRGYFPITGLESWSFSTDEIDASDCKNELDALIQGNFNLEPGEERTVNCSVVFPDVFDSRILGFSGVKFTSSELPGLIKSSNSGLVYFDKAATQGAPAAATTLLNPDPVTDASAVPDPVMDPNRNIALLNNGDFEQFDANNIPINWEVGCSGISSPIENQFGTAVALGADSCLSYVLDSNDLALIAGKSYKLYCEAGGVGYKSMSISLDGQTNETALRNGPNELFGNAPASSAQGYVSLYIGDRTGNFDNCQLLVSKPINATASIDVRNHLEGIDGYRTYGTFDFEVEVENNGDEALQDIEISSDRLSCDTNFASLDVGETKTIVCSATDPMLFWNQNLTHVVTASGVSSSGAIVADSDYASYSGSSVVDIGSSDTYTRQVYANSTLLSNFESITVAPGSDVVIEVRLAHNSDVPLRLITSSVPSCNKIIDPAMKLGDLISYQCTLENVQEETEVTIRPIPLNGVSGGSNLFFVKVQ